MGNGRKQTALWLVFVEGAALSLGIYLLLTVLLSALVVKAVLPEEGSFPAVAASCCLASFAGAMLSVRRSSWGSLASAMVSAAGFLLAVVAGETAAANVGRRRFYVYKILSFFGAGEVISHADFTKLT